MQRLEMRVRCCGDWKALRQRLWYILGFEEHVFGHASHGAVSIYITLREL